MRCMNHFYSLDEIADRMMDRRQELRMTQKDLARAINVDTQTIGRYERGERIPSGDHMVRICLILKMPFAYFIGIESETLSLWASYYEPFFELAGLPARERFRMLMEYFTSRERDVELLKKELAEKP